MNPLLLVLAVPIGVLYGHGARWVERERFKLQMAAHGYRGHGEYVEGPEWKSRRHRYIAGRGRPPCWICRRLFRPHWPIHHLDYSRAGGGHELDRDLRFVCDRCHHNAHRMDRPLGLPRALGVSLRWSTYLVWAIWSPVRLLRRAGVF